MNKEKKYPLTLGIIFPLTAPASGVGDSLDWMGIHMFVVLGFIIFLVLSRLNWTGKGIMILVFIISEYLNAELTVGLPYSDIKLITSVAVPILTTIASYWTLRTKFNKE
jgi:hypothetical protein